MPSFTETEQAILLALSDGCPKPRALLLSCLGDPKARYKTLASHVYNIRAKLRPVGEDLVCEISYRRILYRHVRLLKPVKSAG